MAKKKYYAVRQGRQPGIYTTWDDCKAQTMGFSGAQYKAFATLEEAEAFIGSTPVATANDSLSLNERAHQHIEALEADEALAFVDGSYDDAGKRSGFGAIIFFQGGQVSLYKGFGLADGALFISLRNVAAELEAVKEAVNWACLHEKRRLTLYYDYTGIEEWATGRWQANNAITQGYAQFMREKMLEVTIDFVKVPSHSGITYNEAVDGLAKKALTATDWGTFDQV